MPTSSYLTAHQPAKWARLTRSTFLAYWTSLCLSGSCKQLCKLHLVLNKQSFRLLIYFTCGMTYFAFLFSVNFLMSWGHFSLSRPPLSSSAMAERFSTNFGAKRNEDHKFRTNFPARNEDFPAQNGSLYQFRSDFKLPNDDFVAQNSDFPPNFKLDENNLLASLNSLILGEETPSPPPPPPPPLGLEKLQRSYLTSSKASRGGSKTGGNKRSIFRRLPSLTLLNFSSQNDSW